MAIDSAAFDEEEDDELDMVIDLSSGKSQRESWTEIKVRADVG